MYVLKRGTSKKLMGGDEQVEHVVTATFLASVLLAVIFASRLRFLFSLVAKHLLGGFSFGLSLRILSSQIIHIFHLKDHSCTFELASTVGCIRDCI